MTTDERVGKNEADIKEIAKEIRAVKSTLEAFTKSFTLLYNELAGTSLNGERGALWKMAQNEVEIEAIKRRMVEGEERVDKIVEANRHQHEKDIAAIRATIRNYQYLWAGAVGVLMFIIGWLSRYASVLK